MAKAAKVRQGRPTVYTPELAEKICDLLVCGGDEGRPSSLRKICDREDMPHVASVMRWLARSRAGEKEFEGFSAAYEAARELQADAEQDEMRDIADDAPSTPEGVAKAKLRIATRQWNAEKLRPKKYGSKVVAEHEGEVGLRIIIDDVGDR